MEIERISFQITPEDRTDDFISADEGTWTAWLRQQKGFVRKTYQRYPGGRLDIRIFWATKKDLEKAAKDPLLPAVEVQLRAAFLGLYQRLP